MWTSVVLSSTATCKKAVLCCVEKINVGQLLLGTSYSAVSVGPEFNITYQKLLLNRNTHKRLWSDLLTECDQNIRTFQESNPVFLLRATAQYSEQPYRTEPS